MYNVENNKSKEKTWMKGVSKLLTGTDLYKQVNISVIIRRLHICGEWLTE